MNPGLPNAVLPLLRVAGFLAALGIVVVGPRWAAAQEESLASGTYRVQHWTVEDGLPVNHVTSMAQTPDGYVWIGTWDGLARFDGFDFDVFNVGNTPALESNRIRSLQVGPDGSLWVITEDLALMRYRSGRFENLSAQHGFSVLSVIVAGDSTWLNSNKGLYLVQEDGARLFRQDVPEFRGNTYVGQIVRDGERVLWVTVLDYGLLRIDAGGDVTRFPKASSVFAIGRPPPPGTEAQWSRSVPGCLNRGPQGTIWYTTERGVLRWDGAAFDLMRPTHDPSLVPLCRMFWDEHGHGKVASSRGWLAVKNDSLLVATGTGPRTDLDHAIQGEAGNIWHLRETVLYLNDAYVTDMGNDVATLMASPDGSVWLGNTEGVHRVQRAVVSAISVGDGLLSPNVYSVLAAQEGGVWVGSWGAMREGTQHPPGLSRIQGGKVSQTISTHPWSITSLAESLDGTLWVGTPSGVVLLNGQSRMPLEPSPDHIGMVQAIYEGEAGRLWAGSDQGLFVLEGGAWRKTVVDVAVMAIVARSGGGLWLGTAGGGLGWTPDGTRAEWLTADDGLSSNNVRDVYEDERGVVWVATQDLGLCRLAPPEDAPLSASTAFGASPPVCLTTGDGLYDDSLHRILPDDDGRLWISSNRGLFWARRDQLDAFAQGEAEAVTTVSYTEKDGMRDREANGGRQPAGARTADGRLWFPTQDGVVVVDPATVGVADVPAPLVVSVSTADSAWAATGAVRLPRRTRDVTLSYTTMAFDRPEDVRFRVRLVGYERAWREAGRQREVTYTNLPAGTYRFQVQAGIGGQWSAPTEVRLRRPPQLWEAAWARALFVLLVLGGVVLAFRYRLREARRRELALQREVRRRTAEIRTQKDALAQQADALDVLNAAKDRFVANISHEFRTPLTLAFSPIDDLLNGTFKSVEEARPHFERARFNGHRLMRLVNQLLELAQLEQGALELHPERRDLAAFVTHRVGLFTSVAEAQGIALHADVGAEPLPFVFDAEKVETVLVNLLSNALKFTPAGGRVEVRLRRTDGRAVLVVADTGEGIAGAHLPHLFDRFYQVDASPTRRHEGAGIGLALVKQLVDLHGGTVDAESEPGLGTTFTITLPPLEAPPAPAKAGPAAAGPAVHPGGDVLPTGAPEITAAPAASPAPAAPAARARGAGAKPLVLVVEDNADMRALLREQLAAAYRVEQAADGEEGLARALELVPDLVVSDVMMPRRDGFGLLVALKEDVRTSHVPVLLLTARADAESRLEGLGRGADGYLAKPFARRELLARAANLIEGRRRLRARWQAAPGLSPSEVDLPSEEQAFLEAVRAQAEGHLGDASFGAAELADALAMSPRQLRRKLNHLLGETPAALLRRFRVERAASMLQQSTGSVKEVAAATGFGSSSRFRAVFSQAYGVSPSAYAAGQRAAAASTTTQTRREE